LEKLISVCAAPPNQRCLGENSAVGPKNRYGHGDGQRGLQSHKGEILVNKRILMTLVQIYPAPEHIVVLKDSGIKSVNDMKGKKSH
jgi:hypothetical protein